MGAFGRSIRSVFTGHQPKERPLATLARAGGCLASFPTQSRVPCPVPVHSFPSPSAESPRHQCPCAPGSGCPFHAGSVTVSRGSLSGTSPRGQNLAVHVLMNVVALTRPACIRIFPERRRGRLLHDLARLTLFQAPSAFVVCLLSSVQRLIRSPVSFLLPSKPILEEGKAPGMAENESRQRRVILAQTWGEGPQIQDHR